MSKGRPKRDISDVVIGPIRVKYSHDYRAWLGHSYRSDSGKIISPKMYNRSGAIEYAREMNYRLNNAK